MRIRYYDKWDDFNFSILNFPFISTNIKESSAYGVYRSAYTSKLTVGVDQEQNYDNLDDFKFSILKFSFICSIIPIAPAFRVYITQLIRYSRACGSYHDFLDRGLLQTRKLLNQGFLIVKLMSPLRKFYGRHHDLVNMTTDMFHML